MSRIEMLRLLINQRLTAAAEEIFGVFGRTIAEYEEEISRSKLEIDRQRRLLDLTRKPRVSLQVTGTAVPERSFAADPNQTKPPDIKEEEARQDHAGLLLHGGGVRNGQDYDHVTSTLPKLQSQDPDLQLGPSVQTCPSGDALEGPGNDADATPDSYVCGVCGHVFARRGLWAKHVQGHRRAGVRADRSYTCDICGKRLTRFDGYQKHLRIHTGEKPYGCGECGRRFSDNSNYKRHVRTHAGQKPPHS